MKLFLLSAGLLLGSGLAATQAAPVAGAASGPVAAPSPGPAAPDTGAAIHRLFVAKRRRQNYVAGATTLAVVGTMVALVSSRPAQPAGKNGAATTGVSDLGLAFAACVTVPLIPIAAIGFGGWGPKYERQVLAEWQQHRLPRRIRRALKAKYF